MADNSDIAKENFTIPTKLIDQMVKDRKIRTAIVRQSHFYFFNLYFSHYVKYPTANFQREFFYLTEHDDVKKLFIVSFRGSAKSSIFTMSYPLWAILGQQQKKFVLILCQTRAQAKQMMMNLRRELEGNNLLKNDLGPFQEENDEWGSVSLVFSRLNARITAASSEQSIRGLRHNQHRPDLIVADDLEDIASVKTYEGRQKTYQWLTGEVIPAGDRNTKLIIVGNLLHEDSLLMRLKENIRDGLIDAVFREYPLVNEKGEIAWLGKYPNMESVNEEKRKIGNDYAFLREYMLRIVPSDEQIIHPDWIHYYDELPKEVKLRKNRNKIFMGVDLAISEKESAKFTAIVSAIVHGYGDKFKVYIMPNPINRRMDFPKTIKQILDTYQVNEKIMPDSVKVLVEEVGYQKAVIDQLQNEDCDAIGVKVSTDKRARLMTVGNMIECGKIVFPKHGCEELIRQIVGFGVEKYCDLVDAFTLVANKVIELDKPEPDLRCVAITYGNKFRSTF
jgi:predicted phage terminase large subunit-like protein